MPWEHCGQSVADDVPCPVCALSKEQWSIKFDATRTFKVTRKPGAMLNVELVDLDLEPVHQEPFRAVLPDKKDITGVTDLEGRSNIKSPGGKSTVDFHRLKAKQLVKPKDAEPAAKVAARFLVPNGRKQTFQLTGIFLDFDVEAEDEFMEVVGIPWVLVKPDGLEDGTLDETRRVRVFGEPDWVDKKVTLELFSGPLVRTEFEIKAEDDFRDVVGIPYTVALPDGSTQEGLVDESRVVVVKTREGDVDGISIMLHLSAATGPRVESFTVRRAAGGDPGAAAIVDQGAKAVLAWKVTGAEKVTLVQRGAKGERVVVLDDAPAEGEHEVSPEPPRQTFGIEASAGQELELGDDVSVTVASTIGKIHMQLLEVQEHRPLAGEPYRLTSAAGQTLTGTTGPDGSLRHEAVPIGDWTLTLDRSGVRLRALVLAADDPDPLVRTLLVRRAGR